MPQNADALGASSIVRTRRGSDTLQRLVQTMEKYPWLRVKISPTLEDGDSSLGRGNRNVALVFANSVFRQLSGKKCADHPFDSLFKRRQIFSDHAPHCLKVDIQVLMRNDVT